MKVADSLKLLRLHVFLSCQQELDVEVEHMVMNGVIWKLGTQYQEYCVTLPTSQNKNTQFVAQFIDMMDRWKSCIDAVWIGDWASMEVASIDWMPVWVALQKPLYQMETMRRLEVLYNMSPEELEYHCMNSFFWMHTNGNFMSFDDFCEKHNYAMKQIVNHPDI